MILIKIFKKYKIGPHSNIYTFIGPMFTSYFNTSIMKTWSLLPFGFIIWLFLNYVLHEATQFNTLLFLNFEKKKGLH
jgi:hypothetical protein